MPDATTTISQLRELVEQFVAERNWHQFHAPKNLAMALAIEAAELMEHFQWESVEQSRRAGADGERREGIADELADVTCYVLAMANALDIDLSAAVRDKMVKNRTKYPVDKR
jgi:dCTP diphosphatase